MKVNLLGIEYVIKSVDSHRDMFDNNNVAECDYSDKSIKICENDYNGDKYSDTFLQESLYHELAHVFMYETGQADINDERHAELLAHFAKFIGRNNELFTK